MDTQASVADRVITALRNLNLKRN